MPEFMMHTSYWISVLQIITIDILLGGDNAVVIALVCRKLPAHLRNKGIAWGVVGAIAMRVVLIFFALQLLALPFLKIVGAILLIWIGIKLLQPEEGGHTNVHGSATLIGAIKTIVVADTVMSLDNVIAVAGAAKGDFGLVVFGILISIPIIVWGSKLVLRLMDRFPVIIALGAGLLGWVSGDMIISDIALKPHLTVTLPWLHYLTGVAGAILVVVVGRVLATRKGVKVQAPISLTGAALVDRTKANK